MARIARVFADGWSIGIVRAFAHFPAIIPAYATALLKGVFQVMAMKSLALAVLLTVGLADAVLAEGRGTPGRRSPGSSRISEAIVVTSLFAVMD